MCVCVCACVCVAEPVAVDLRCHATALILGSGKAQFRQAMLSSDSSCSVMSERSHRFLGITSTFWEVNVSCSRIQHGDLSEDLTLDLSLQSPTLYH